SAATTSSSRFSSRLSASAVPSRRSASRRPLPSTTVATRSPNGPGPATIAASWSMSRTNPPSPRPARPPNSAVARRAAARRGRPGGSREGRRGGRGQVLQAAGGGAADPAGRRSEGPAEPEVVRGIRDEPEIREHVLDLPPLVEAYASHNVIGHGGDPEGVLQHARLRVHPVQHGDAVERQPVRAELGHGARYPQGLLGLVAGPEEPRGISGCVLGPERLLLPDLVVGDHRGGDLQNPARRAIVLLEADDATPREVPLEVEDVPEVRAAEPVDRLVGVADHAEISVTGRELAEESVLGGVRVLVLVDEDVSPEVAVVVEDVGVPREELYRQP